MHILIIAPHQDDEILSSCMYIQSQIKNGNHIFVAFLTNGDSQGKENGLLRFLESSEVLKILGVPEDNILYLGYGDTGMRLEKSFLYRLFNSYNYDIQTSFVASETYHPAGKETIHYIHTGQEASYCRENFIIDLNYLLNQCEPDIIILPSHFDKHGDHYACSMFFKELQEYKNLPSLIMTYIMHVGDDSFWPDRESFLFLRPSIVDQEVWEKRIIFKMSEKKRLEKMKYIQLFHTQIKNDNSNYLISFAKREEVFLPF